MPVAHADEDLDHMLRQAARQRLLKRLGLRLGLRQDRRAAAELAIDLGRDLGAAARNQPGKWSSDQVGQIDDGAIEKQIAQKWPHGSERVRTAEIEQHDRKTHGANRPRSDLSRRQIAPAYKIDQLRDVLRRRLLQDAMSEIEDEAA